MSHLNNFLKSFPGLRATIASASCLAVIGALLSLLPYMAASLSYDNNCWWARVLYSWPNAFSLAAFGGATGLLVARWAKLSKHRTGFEFIHLPDDPTATILPEDARLCRRGVRTLPPELQQLTPLRLLDAGLQRAQAKASADEVRNTIDHQADLIARRSDSQYSTINYLCWAIPSFGFLGTVQGISNAVYYFTAHNKDMLKAALSLGTAFDTTFVSLTLILVLKLLYHKVQAKEDAFLVEATEWVTHRFTNRVHVPKE